MRVKKALLYAAIVFGLLAVISPFVLNALQPAWQTRIRQGQQLSAVTAFIQRNGLQPEVNRLLAEAPKPKGWVASFVKESQMPPRPGEGVLLGEQQILAADPPELVGQSYYALFPQRARSGHSVRVQAPDGRQYDVGMAYTFDIWRVLTIINWLMILFAATAWVALALWVFLDARERASKAAPAWLLLALLTGPVALAVWLISRYAQDGSLTAAAVCPGCGAAVPKGLPYCVKCGHALHPVCPVCKRTVEVEWSHCGHCGADLKEDA